MKAHEGKKAVITGGTTGLGLTTAKLLIEQGARVMVTGHTQTTVDAALADLGPNAFAVRSDASSLADIDALAERVMAEFGSFELLHVNAGVTRFAPLENMTEALYDEVFAVNAKGAYFVVQKLAPLMTRGSAVVFTTSISQGQGTPMVSAYAASKAAVRSMVRSMATELLPRGIRVNAVSPGPIDTSILERSLPAEAAAQARLQMIERNPMKRFGRPEEVARAVLFLAFDATYTTGAELVVDGGRTQL